MSNTDSEWDILHRIPKILCEESASLVSPTEPVIKFHIPHELELLLDWSIEPTAFRVPPTNEAEQESINSNPIAAAVEYLCRRVARLSVKTGHRFFCNQLFGGVDPVGLSGSWLTEALNTSQYTFEVAPAFTLIENVLLEKCLQLFGFTSGEGLFSPGGSISNMYAMALARYRQNPEYKRKGLFGSAPLVAFTSVEAHYSLKKAAHWIGLGLDNLELVDTNERGQMCSKALNGAIERIKATGDEKRVPFFVCATAGTTVLGAFDNLTEISEICQRHGIWLHVDACLGGSAVFAPVRKAELLEGINLADSLAWNPHKSLGVPLQCSMLLTRHEGLLHQCNSANADYLFQQDKFYDTNYDSGDKSVQCGRKVDAFKFWLMLKVRGLTAFQRMVDHNFQLRDYFVGRLEESANFRLVLPEFQYTNVCFWYIPERLLVQPETAEWWTEVYKVTTGIKARLVINGSAMISYCPLKPKGLGNFFRMVFTSFPRRSTTDVDDLIGIIRRTGETL